MAKPVDNRIKEHTVLRETKPGKFAQTTVRGTDADLAEFLAAGTSGGTRSIESVVVED